MIMKAGRGAVLGICMKVGKGAVDTYTKEGRGAVYAYMKEGRGAVYMHT